MRSDHFIVENTAAVPAMRTDSREASRKLLAPMASDLTGDRVVILSNELEANFDFVEEVLVILVVERNADLVIFEGGHGLIFAHVLGAARLRRIEERVFILNREPNL